jgi:phosphoserine phosphatase
LFIRLEVKRKINSSGYDVVAFDCDSTLSAVEGIDLLADRHGKKELVEEITHKAMNGHSNYAEALQLRLSLVRPNTEDLKWLTEMYIKRTTRGTKTLIKRLKSAGKRIYIISGGFENALIPFAEYLGIPEYRVFGNKILFNPKGEYLGFDKDNPLSRNHGKRSLLKQIAKTGSTVFVGDGITDLEAKDVVDLFVGFGGIKVRDVVKNEADIFLETPTLDAIFDISSGNLTNYNNKSRIGLGVKF